MAGSHGLSAIVWESCDAAVPSVTATKIAIGKRNGKLIREGNLFADTKLFHNVQSPKKPRAVQFVKRMVDE